MARRKHRVLTPDSQVRSEADMRRIGEQLLEDVTRGDVQIEELVSLPGGGTRSKGSYPYHLIPPEGFRRTAERFAFGARRHGTDSWKKSIQCEADALVWARMCYDHMIEHALKMVTGAFPDDDHLGAIGWAQTVLCHIEAKYGMLWTSLGGVKKP